MNLKKVVVFSGAGISAESGIDTFRDSGGLWEKHNIEDVATPEAFARNPSHVLEFYNQRRRKIAQVKPNEAHNALVELEKHFEVDIITQNIDDLHERAGSRRVLHLHGLITECRDTHDDETIYELGFNNISLGDVSPQGGQLRPHIVWFGEAVPAMEEAEQLVSQADVLIVVGTSLNVYPAAGLAFIAPKKALKYIIDPQAGQLNLPNGFIAIAQKAGIGIKQVLRQLVTID